MLMRMDWGMLLWLAAVLLVCGLFAWTLNGAKAARTEAYQASLTRQRAEKQLLSLQRAWLRHELARELPALRQAKTIVLPQRLADITPGAAGQPAMLAEVRAILEASARLSENALDAESAWRLTCRPELAAELSHLLPSATVAP